MVPADSARTAVTHMAMLRYSRKRRTSSRPPPGRRPATISGGMASVSSLRPGSMRNAMEAHPCVAPTF